MYMIKKRGWIIGFALIVVLAACGGKSEAINQEQQPKEPSQHKSEDASQHKPEVKPQEEEGEKAEGPVDMEGVPPTALEAAATVMKALKNGDMATIASWAHLEQGIRFSPYAHVDPEKDVVMKRSELEGAMKDPSKRLWGAFDGSGEPIELTYADYHRKFVYDEDFAGKGEVALNKRLGTSTTLDNLRDVYPQERYDVVEYYISAIDPQYEGMDWRSLRLVFERIGEDHALVGIVHDQWTI